MSNLVFNLSADEGEAVQAFLKVLDAQTRVSAGMTEIGKRSKETSRSFADISNDFEKSRQKGDGLKDSIGGAIGKISALAAGTSAFAAVAKSSFDDAISRVAKYSEVADQLLKTLARGGQVELLPKVRSDLKALAGGLIDEKQSAALFDKISLQGGTEATPQQKLEAFGESVFAGNAGLDMEAFGKTFIELRKGAFKDAAKEDVSEITAKVLRDLPQGLAGDQIKTLNRFTASGGDAMQGLEMIMAGARSEEGAKTISAVLEASQKEITDEDLKGKMEVRPESKRRIDEIESERLRIREQQNELEKADLVLAKQEADSGVSRREKKKLAESRKQLSLQQATLSEQDRDLSLEADRLSQDKTAVTSAEQDRLARLNAIPKDERFAAMIADESLAPESLRPELKNLQSAVNAGEISTAIEGRELGQQAASAARFRNTDRRAGMQAAINRQEVARRNREMNVSVDDMELAFERNEIDASMDKAGIPSAGRTAINETLGVVQGGMRMGLGAMGAVDKAVFGKSKPVRVEVVPKGNLGARSKGSE